MVPFVTRIPPDGQNGQRRVGQPIFNSGKPARDQGLSIVRQSTIETAHLAILMLLLQLRNHEQSYWESLAVSQFGFDRHVQFDFTS